MISYYLQYENRHLGLQFYHVLPQARDGSELFGTASQPWSTSQPYRFHLPGAALAQHLCMEFSSKRKGIIEAGSVATPRLTSLNHQNRWGNLSELCDSPVIGVPATTAGVPFIGQNDQPVV